MEAEIAAAYARWHDQARAALVATAEEVLAAAKRDAPYDPAGTKHLRDSGAVEPVQYRAGGIMSVDIVFKVPWAAKQHERMDFHHPHGGTPKYLERNIKGARLLDALARAQARAL
jgi:Bacteriophage HK97-gp10, putative tail-component